VWPCIFCHFFGIVCSWGLCKFGSMVGFYGGFPCNKHIKILFFKSFGSQRCVEISQSGLIFFGLYDCCVAILLRIGFFGRP
jgi:hypothetical protein